MNEYQEYRNIIENYTNKKVKGNDAKILLLYLNDRIPNLNKKYSEIFSKEELVANVNPSLKIKFIKLLVNNGILELHIYNEKNHFQSFYCNLEDNKIFGKQSDASNEDYLRTYELHKKSMAALFEEMGTQVSCYGEWLYKSLTHVKNIYNGDIIVDLLYSQEEGFTCNISFKNKNLNNRVYLDDQAVDKDQILSNLPVNVSAIYKDIMDNGMNDAITSAREKKIGM